MPPKIPPDLLEVKIGCPSLIRISSAFSSPRNSAAAKPTPNSTALTALILIIALAISASILS